MLNSVLQIGQSQLGSCRHSSCAISEGIASGSPSIEINPPYYEKLHQLIHVRAPTAGVCCAVIRSYSLLRKRLCIVDSPWGVCHNKMILSVPWRLLVVTHESYHFPCPKLSLDKSCDHYWYELFVGDMDSFCSGSGHRKESHLSSIRGIRPYLDVRGGISTSRKGRCHSKYPRKWSTIGCHSCGRYGQLLQWVWPQEGKPLVFDQRHQTILGCPGWNIDFQKREMPFQVSTKVIHHWMSLLIWWFSLTLWFWPPLTQVRSYIHVCMPDKASSRSYYLYCML